MIEVNYYFIYICQERFNNKALENLEKMHFCQNNLKTALSNGNIGNGMTIAKSINGIPVGDIGIAKFIIGHPDKGNRVDKFNNGHIFERMNVDKLNNCNFVKNMTDDKVSNGHIVEGFANFLVKSSLNMAIIN